MFPQRVLLYVTACLLIQSVQIHTAHGLGTSSNYFQFVILGTHGVTPTHLAPADDSHSSEISLNPSVRFGSRSFSSVWINTNGLISFNSAHTSSQTVTLSSSSAPSYVIAPFWSDIDTTSNGQIRYELHDQYTSSRSTSSQLLLTQVSNYIREVTGYTEDVHLVLVVEWKDVRKYGSSSGPLANTFQALIVSSVLRSYAIFTYACGEIDWSTSLATIGYKAESGLYRNHPYSRNSSRINPIACVNYPDSYWSNVVYKIYPAESCSTYQYGCSSGECVSTFDRCDNYYYSCSDQSDEAWCQPGCSQSRCVSSGSCISDQLVCDGTRDCTDGSDEWNCPTTPTTTYIECYDQFRCSTGNQCVTSRDRCDGYTDCNDGSDEYNCPTTPSIYCYSYQFRCSTGNQCVYTSDRCDGHSDCNDGSDEYNCPTDCYSFQFRCSTGNQCVYSSGRCDGHSDCNDGSDEHNCPASVGTIVGATIGSIIGLLICVGVSVIIIHCVIKKRRVQPARFRQLTTTPSVINTPGATPTTPQYAQVSTNSQNTQSFYPKPDEWYCTVEGQWVQGPPPAYSFDAGQGEGAVPQVRGGDSFQLELMNGQNVGSGQSTNMTAQPARMASLDQIVSLSPQMGPTSVENHEPELTSQDIIANHSPNDVAMEEFCSQVSVDEPEGDEDTPLIES